MWEFVNIIDAEDDDAALYPILSSASSTLPIELDQRDGQDPVRLHATRVLVSHARPDNTGKSIHDLAGLKFEVVITDARVIVYCEKFTKGGGWTGFGGVGVAIAITSNAISAARAANRRRGKLLVGQIRYPWLGRVGASPKKDWRTADLLRMTVFVEGVPRRALDIRFTLTKDSHVAEVAAEITRRAARYKLGNVSLDSDSREALEKLTKATPLVLPDYSGIKQPYADHALPATLYVQPLTAYGTPTLEAESPTAGDTEGASTTHP
jgi:hypothetical protein